MKNSIKVTFIVLVLAVAVVWGIVAYGAIKPEYDYSIKAECTYWNQDYCVFESKLSGDEFVWEFNANKMNTGSLDDCTSVNCGGKYLLRMDDGVDETTIVDDEIVSYSAISLVEYLQ